MNCSKGLESSAGELEESQLSTPLLSEADEAKGKVSAAAAKPQDTASGGK